MRSTFSSMHHSQEAPGRDHSMMRCTAACHPDPEQAPAPQSMGRSLALAPCHPEQCMVTQFTLGAILLHLLPTGHSCHRRGTYPPVRSLNLPEQVHLSLYIHHAGSQLGWQLQGRCISCQVTQQHVVR